jgi:hypothetical protein
MFCETWCSSGLHGDWSCSVPSRGPLCSTWHAALNTQAIAGNSSSTSSEVALYRPLSVTYLQFIHELHTALKARKANAAPQHVLRSRVWLAGTIADTHEPVHMRQHRRAGRAGRWRRGNDVKPRGPAPPWPCARLSRLAA